MRILGFEFGRSGGAAETVVPAVRQRISRGTGSARTAGSAMVQRSFDAARTDRIVSSWATSDETVNMALLSGLKLMRARSRDFFRNNEYGRKFSQLVRTNIVGHNGFTLKVDCRRPDGSPDKADGDRIKAAYLRWTRTGHFDVTGRYAETLFDQTAINMIARDGEVLVRLVEGMGIHGAQVQLLPGHLLDEEHNRDLANGNRIRMGVEFDSWMKPVAYHLRIVSGTADMYGASTRRYERVPATEMLHLFVPEEAEQWRGIPWAFASLRSARLLDQFNEAALVAANIGASKMGFFKQQDGAEGPPTNTDINPDGEQDEPVFTTEVTPGQFDVIPPGYDFQEFNPDYPSAVYDPFTTAVVRKMAVGTGLVSHHSISGDLTDVNFSSIRSGTLDEREAWKVLQGLFIQFKIQIFEFWLARAMVNDADLRSLPYAKFDKFNAPVFTGRRWDWVSPKDDVAAQRDAVALGVKSRAEIIRESGREPEEVWAELAAEEAAGFKAPATPGAAPANKEPAAAGQ